MTGEICRPPIAVFVFWIGLASAGTLPAQNLNTTAASSTNLIGRSLPTVQRPVRGLPATKTGRIKYSIQFGQEFAVGYVATEITLQSQTRFPADRDLVFRFRGIDGEVYPPRRNLVVEVPVSVQQGKMSQTFIRYLPRWAITRKLSIDVLEQGRVIPEFSAEINLPSNPGLNFNLPRASRTNFRYASVALESELKLDCLLAINSDKPTRAESSVLKSLSQLTETPAEFHSLKKLPTDWRAYQRFDVIVVSPNLCKQFNKHPDAMAAVRHWLMLGGTLLIVGDCDPAEIVAELGISDTAEATLVEQVESVAANLKQQWVQAEDDAKNGLAGMSKALSGTAPGALSMSTTAVYGSFDLSPQQNVDRWKSELRSLGPAQARTPRQWRQRIWIRQVAAGRVLGMPAESKTQKIEKPDFDVIQGLISYRTSPMLRRGVDPMIGDSRFRDWLIPGVAQPPVYTFIGLLTAFVILVGPIAYRQTARHHRSHLMFLIAPVLALTTTAMMFAYGIISDGFGTMARIRQLTLVDGTSGTGVERIRSTYFAGVRPANGLRFGAFDEVMAHPETRGIAWADQLSDTPQVIGQVSIDEGEQRFDSSFLPSRSQTQFVVHRPVPDIGSLRVDTTDDGSVILNNGFGFPLKRIVVRRSEKEYLSADLIRADSTAKANTPDAKVVTKKLGSLYNDFRPILSASTEAKTYRNSGKTVDLLRELMQSVAPRNASYDGVFEFAFRERLQTRLDIPVGHFVAISDVSEDVVAVAGTEQVGCVRYIMGTFVEEESQ